MGIASAENLPKPPRTSETISRKWPLNGWLILVFFKGRCEGLHKMATRAEEARHLILPFAKVNSPGRSPAFLLSFSTMLSAVQLTVSSPG